MRISDLDLNLLLVFTAVMKRRSVTLAGEDLGMTQSAISNALRRLRLNFSDPLFVKAPKGMAPTPLAERLIGPLQDAVDRIQTALDDASEFDQATSKRLFRIYMSDLGQMILMPRLIRVLEREAPGIRMQVVDHEPRVAQSLMVEGGVDVSIGTFDSFQAGFHSQRLFQKSYVVIGRKGHPELRNGLAMKAFLRARHAVYHPPAGSHDDFDQVVSRIFKEHGVDRHISVELAHGLGIVEVIAASELLMCVPRRLATSLAASDALEVAALPFESPNIDVSQFWHHRFHADPGHRWIRSLIFRHYSTM